MFRKIQEARENEEGFTLIELLVVVIIIGILAAIAIPVFLNQRESAWRSAAESDARNAAIAVETYYTQESSYPLTDGTTATWTAGSNTIAGTDIEVTVSENVELTYTNVADSSFTITATHSQIDSGGTTVATYNSATGGLE